MADVYAAPIIISLGAVAAVAAPLYYFGFAVPQRPLAAFGIFLFAVICGLVPTSLLSRFSRVMHMMRRTHASSRVAHRRWNYNEIRPRLFLGRQPRTLADVREMQSKGVTAFVALNEEWELFVPSSAYATLETPLARLQLPVPDYAAPTLDKLEEAATFVQRHLEEGGAVYVHCNAGKGRSSVVVAAHLMATEKDAHASAAACVLHLRTLRPQVSLGLLDWPFRAQARILRRFHSKVVERRRSEVE